MIRSGVEARDQPFPSIRVPRRVEHVDSFDLTRLCVTSWGRGPHTLVLSPGLATPPTSYDYLVERFAPHLRVITWDMRGSYRSDRPALGAAAQRVEDSARDLAIVAAHFGLDRFVVGGWSMGVQISLEYAFHHPEHVEGLILLNGGFGHVLDHVMGFSPLGKAIQAGLKVVTKAPGATDRIASFVLGRRLFLEALFATGVVSANKPFVLDVIRQFRELDFGTYFPMMQQLHAHSAEAYLPHILVPTLVTAGTHDQMTPVRSAETMARAIPNAELLVVDGGTHYTPLEYPHAVNDAVNRLLERVWPDWQADL